MNKSPLSGIIILTIFLLFISQGYSQFSEDQINQAGVSQLNAGNFKSAAEIFLLGKALYPNNPQFPYNYAVVLFLSNNLPQAV